MRREIHLEETKPGIGRGEFWNDCLIITMIPDLYALPNGQTARDGCIREGALFTPYHRTPRARVRGTNVLNSPAGQRPKTTDVSPS